MMLDSTNSAGAVIEATRLHRRFGDLQAVADVSFEVSRGEVFGFLGPNGAGKTTTIDMLTTLLRPTAGTAAINGCDVVTDPRGVRRSIGLVFQRPTLDESLTAEQNLRFHAYAYGVSARLRDDRIRRLVTMVELWDRRKESVRTFSGGMRRRLEIARGLVHDPVVLFLDEPTLGLDPQTRRRIWDYLTELREREELTIFLTTHHMDEAEICDRVAVIDHGRIVAMDTPERLKSQVGGDLVTFTTSEPLPAADEVRRRYGLSPSVEDHSVRFLVSEADNFLPDFVRTFTQPLQAIAFRRPTLDDVFLHLTGHEIRDDGEPATAAKRSWRKRRMS
jgi:ABC-2 type transport system ATP-binding protein